MVRTSVRGASVFGPSLESITFRADAPRAFVIDRAGLDVYLANRAVGAGAEIRTSTRFDGIEGESGDRLTVRLRGPDGGHEEVRTRLVIGADGVASAVARAFRLRRPVEVLPAFEAEFPVSPGDPDTVEVYLGRKFAPGLFGWWIPDGAGGARVGVATDADGTPTRQYLRPAPRAPRTSFRSTARESDRLPRLGDPDRDAAPDPCSTRPPRWRRGRAGEAPLGRGHLHGHAVRGDRRGRCPGGPRER